MSNSKDVVYVQNNEKTESKTAIGIVMGIFLSLIGLVVGLILYPSGSFERKTFTKGWLIAFFVMLAIEVILFIAFGGMLTNFVSGII